MAASMRALPLLLLLSTACTAAFLPAMVPNSDLTTRRRPPRTSAPLLVLGDANTPAASGAVDEQIIESAMESAKKMALMGWSVSIIATVGAVATVWASGHPEDFQFTLQQSVPDVMTTVSLIGLTVCLAIAEEAGLWGRYLRHREQARKSAIVLAELNPSCTLLEDTEDGYVWYACATPATDPNVICERMPVDRWGTGGGHNWEWLCKVPA